MEQVEFFRLSSQNWIRKVIQLALDWLEEVVLQIRDNWTWADPQLLIFESYHQSIRVIQMTDFHIYPDGFTDDRRIG